MQPYPLPLGKDKMLEIELMPAVSERVSRDSIKKLNNGIERASKWAFGEAEKVASTALICVSCLPLPFGYCHLCPL